jgi:hypothetical protein
MEGGQLPEVICRANPAARVRILRYQHDLGVFAQEPVVV